MMIWKFLFVLPVRQQMLFATRLLMSGCLLVIFLAAARPDEQSPLNPPEVAGKTKKIQDVSFKTDDKFLIRGRYFPGEELTAGVLILHDCHRDSRSYNELGKTLSDNGLHALTVDLRGFGGSTSAAFSQQKIKKAAKDINTYINDIAEIVAYWEGDVIEAYLYLRTKMDRSKEISVVASGCSSAQAVSLADKMHINSMVLITPVMSYADKERFKNLSDIPSYFINSAQHLTSYNTSKELFDWNGSRQSKIQIFKGTRVEQALLNANHYLVEDITLWLKANH